MKSLTVLLLFSFFFPETKAQDSLYLVDTITGESYQKRITNVDKVGDVNGDGYDDFMVSSRTGNIRRDQGIVQLYLGSATFDLTPDVTFHYPCCDSLNNIGNASEIGDVNGDGYDDFAISGSFGDFGFAKGKVFLYYGGETIDTIPVAEFYEPWIQDGFGGVIEKVGDLNKDGYGDFTVSSVYNWSNGFGYVYLFWGGDTISFDRSLTLTSGSLGDFFGVSVANIGDINNDNYEDIAIGAPSGVAGNDTSKVYIFYGGNLMDTDFDTILTANNLGYEFGKSIKNICNLNGDEIVDFCIAGYEYILIYFDLLNQPLEINGYSLDTGGDINGDGFDDFIIGYERKINVYLGSENFDINPDIIIDDSLRFSTQYIYIVGDLNKDGFDEIISFAPNYPNAVDPQGRVYIYSYNKLTDIKDYQNNFLNNFELQQNYPNPFNPSTSIQYAIASRQFVTIKIYDVLGNEIATLVNEEKVAGIYEVKFDASKLASGIYYYQLRAGEFVETKKMILLK
jgi:hypothetical protein